MQLKKQRRRLRASGTSLLILPFLTTMWAPSVAFHPSFLMHPFSKRTLTSPSAKSSTRILVSSKTLESLTVKELRDLLKDVPMERGTLSKLKRKKDLVSFLERQLEHVDPEILNGPSTSENGEGTQISAHEEVQKLQSEHNTKDIEINQISSHEEEQQIHLVHDTKDKKRIGKMPPLEQHKLNTITEKMGRIGNMPPLDQQNVNTDGIPSQEEEKKESWKEFIFDRYPPLREQENRIEKIVPSLGNEDIRQSFHPMLIHPDITATSTMELITLGTASCSPSITRGVSCTALRVGCNKDPMNNGVWLFDAGECTQLQMQRTTVMKGSQVTKIFVTHSHGDHTFGLPGLLCHMGQNHDRSSPPIEIYGPEGLRSWLRIAIRYSVSRIVPNYRVHELMQVPMAPEWRVNQRHSNRKSYYNSLKQPPPNDPYKWKKGLAGDDPESWITQARNMNLKPSRNFGEVEGGRNIIPDYKHPKSYNDAPVWDLLADDEEMKVYASPMSHTVPCVGYVVQEPNQPGRLRNDLVEPIVRRNFQALKDAGFKVPMKAMAVIKDLPPGGAFTFPDGSVVHQHEAVEPYRKGRKVVICGDTSNAWSLTNLGKDADLLVHEATNAYVNFLDINKKPRQVTYESLTHGHSTPEVAGKFCKKLRAKRLILNHFSPRYKGDASFDSISLMTQIEQKAMWAAEKDESKVMASWDFMRLPLPAANEVSE